MAEFRNNLLHNVSQNRICTALGVKIVQSPDVVLIAKSAGYDSLFIDLEHTTITINTAGVICTAALLAGITPFVRVPHECGDGFIQRVLDAGAMGVIVPHIHTVADARRVARISKYPPVGKRSLTGALPQFGLKPTPANVVTAQLNEMGSTVICMVEEKDCLENIDEIAQVPGVDVLLVGANDLAVEIGVLGDWDNPIFMNALARVAAAAKKHGKIFGIGGLYNRPDILSRVIHDLGARYVLGHLDIGLLTGAAINNVVLLKDIGDGKGQAAKPKI